jgi:hypothetical protein
MLAVWIFGAGVLGLMQVWIQYSKYHRELRMHGDVVERSICLMLSVADGSLFIFSISTAGGGLGAALTYIYHALAETTHGSKGSGTILMLLLLYLFIIVFCALEWTYPRPKINLDQASVIISEHARKVGLSEPLQINDIFNSIFFAFMALIASGAIEVER